MVIEFFSLNLKIYADIVEKLVLYFSGDFFQILMSGGFFLDIL